MRWPNNEIGQILTTQQKSVEALPHLERAVRLSGQFPEALSLWQSSSSKQSRMTKQSACLKGQSTSSPIASSALQPYVAYRNVGPKRRFSRQKAETRETAEAPEGEFTEFLKKLGDKVPQQ